MINFQKIAILGVGLIGGSIALGLKRQLGREITILGLCSSPKKAKAAKSRGIIDQELKSLQSLPQNVDLIILAAPILENIKLLESLAQFVSKDTLLLDTSSTKKVICDRADHLSLSSFIGTHPMSGRNTSGLEFADPNLFINKPWIICPSEKTNQKDLHLIKKIITLLGAKPVIMAPDQHDHLVAFASHLFLIISSILVNTLSNQPESKAIFHIASTGFRDTTRLASHNPRLKRDIFITNKTNLKDVLNSLQKEIDNFSQMDGLSILEYFNIAKNTRNHWLTHKFS